jgi:hypothetical protein
MPSTVRSLNEQTYHKRGWLMEMKGYVLSIEMDVVINAQTNRCDKGRHCNGNGPQSMGPETLTCGFGNLVRFADELVARAFISRALPIPIAFSRRLFWPLRNVGFPVVVDPLHFKCAWPCVMEMIKRRSPFHLKFDRRGGLNGDLPLPWKSEATVEKHAPVLLSRGAGGGYFHHLKLMPPLS